MVSLINRFHGHNSLRQVYQKGASEYASSCKLLWLPSARKQYRVAVVVSKKVHKSAVVRNRIRRRIYEVTRIYMQQNSGAYDYVFVVQSEKLAHCSPEQLTSEIVGLLKKTKS